MTISKQKRASTTRTSALAKRIAKAVSTPSRRAKTAKTNKKKGSIGRSLLTSAGGALGSLIGMKDLGRRAGDAFSDLVGLGDYSLNSNSFMRNSTQAPVFDHGEGFTEVTHTELVTDVIGSINFSSQSFIVDPTNAALFPVLSNIATSYEQYEFAGLVFTYKPTSGSAVSSSNNALGTVMLATEYDVARPKFISKADMEAYHFSTSCAPCDLMHHPVECNPKMDVVNKRYTPSPVRPYNGSTTETGTLGVQANLNYLGRLQLAVVGMQANSITLGELWVTYRVKLYTPRKPGPSNYCGFFHATSLTDIPIGNTTSIFAGGFNTIADSTSSLGAVWLSSSGSTAVINTTGLAPGNKLIITLYQACGSGGTVSQTTASFVGSVTGLAQFGVNSSSTSGVSGIAAGNGTQFAISSFCCLVNSFSAGSITFPAPTVAGATCSWDLSVNVVPYWTPPNAIISMNYDEMEDELASIKRRLRELETTEQSFIRVAEACSSTSLGRLGV